MSQTVPSNEQTVAREFSLSEADMERLKKQFVNRKTRKAALKRGEALAVAAFLEAHPEPVSKAQVKSLKMEYQVKFDHLEALLGKRRRTSDFTRLYKMTPMGKLSWLDRFTGAVAAFTLGAAVITIPVIAGISIFEAEKFALLQDDGMAWLSIVFGISPFAGILSAVMWREKLGTDTARDQFDRTLLKTTVLVLVIWAILAALTAFPIGGDISTRNGFKNQGSTDGFRLGVSPAVLLVWTMILDLCAAPTLHAIVEEKLFKKHFVGTEPNPDAIYLDQTLIPQARDELTRVETALGAARNTRSAHKNARKAAILRVIAELEGVTTDLRMAQARAAASLFDHNTSNQNPQKGD